MSDLRLDVFAAGFARGIYDSADGQRGAPGQEFASQAPSH